MADNRLLPPDHMAKAALNAPDTAAGPYINIGKTAPPDIRRALEIVPVIRVAAIDNSVSGLHKFRKLLDRLTHQDCGHHDPYRSRLVERRDEVLKRSGPHDAFLHQRLLWYWADDHSPRTRAYGAEVAAPYSPTSGQDRSFPLASRHSLHT